MKATCPSCSTSYRVADNKVPDTGAQIKCPKCETLFVVRRPAGEKLPPPPAAPPVVASPPVSKPVIPPPSSLPPHPEFQAPQAAPQVSKHDQATPLHELSGKSPAEAPPSGLPPELDPGLSAAPPPKAGETLTPNLDSLQGEGFVSVAGRSEVQEGFIGNDGEAKQGAGKSPASSQARGVSAIRAQSGTKPKATLLESYRVRTSRGLTYDFSTRDAMIRWLSEREDLEGCEAAEPGGNWVPAESLMEFQGAQSASTGEVVALTPGAPVPARHVPAPMAASRSETLALGKSLSFGEPAGAVLWSLSVLTLLLMLFVAAGTLNRYGLVDLTSYMPFEAIGFGHPGPGTEVDAEVLSSPEAKDPEKVFREALGAGRKSIQARRFSRAALEYNRALSIHPGSVDALEGLARAYKGLGDRDRAISALKKARSLKGK